MTAAAALLENGEVHTVAVRLNLAGAASSSARGRAQARSQQSRAATCTVLARYLGVPAAGVRFTTGLYGKPELATSSPIRFNLAHSGDLLVIAVAAGLEVGVDVEHLRPMPRALALARRFFRPEEADTLEGVSREQLDRAFLHCWTQKEAYLKAIGTGLHTDPQSFSVACKPGAPGRLGWISGDDAACWSMYTWQPSAEYLAALAFRDRARRLRRLPLIHEAELKAE